MSIFSSFYSHPYSICERVLRTAVFQYGVINSSFEKSLIWIYKAFADRTFSPNVFDPEKAKKTLRIFESLGAIIESVVPKDGQATIQMMHFRANDLEEKIEAHGATWERLTIIENNKEKEIFAIKPPQATTSEWQAFEEKLTHLKWKRRSVEIKSKGAAEVIVTCEDAAKVPDADCHRKLYLHVNPPDISFNMQTRRAGFYLGHKQNICFYNSRGTSLSNGISSEAGFYNDAMKTYEMIKDSYLPEDIWVTSACGGVAAAAYLKSQLHTTGVNFIFESGYSDLKKDWVDPQGLFASKFAYRYWTALASRDIPSEHIPIETGFNIAALWQDLQMTDLGKVIVIPVANDQRLSPEADQRLLQLVQKVNKHVRHVIFSSADKHNPHSDSFYNYVDPSNQVLSYIFG